MYLSKTSIGVSGKLRLAFGVKNFHIDSARTRFGDLVTTWKDTTMKAKKAKKAVKKKAAKKKKK